MKTSGQRLIDKKAAFQVQPIRIVRLRARKKRAAPADTTARQLWPKKVMPTAIVLFVTPMSCGTVCGSIGPHEA
ncbi:hypothetical protein [Bordetella genomosp. 9]|uniref:hypothetical protein n=1 Tax=Bordetella genomosp. 9 TaxID=1416803 RepID=UPI0012FCBFA2|nr:hypothetical protein [Bordetella genomosp. 9]